MLGGEWLALISSKISARRPVAVALWAALGVSTVIAVLVALTVG